MTAAARRRFTTVLGAVALVVLSAGAGPARAVDSEEERATIRGLDTLAVIVDLNGADVSKDLTKAQIAQAVEEQVRKAGGVKLKSQDDYNKDPLLAGLHVTLTFHKPRDYGVYSYLLRVEVVQTVALARDPKVRIVAPTWYVEGAGTVAADAVGEVRGTIAEYVQDFIKAQALMNPKPGK